MPRKVKVATTSWNTPAPTGADSSLEFACQLLETAGASGADLCVLPEGFNFIGVPPDERASHVEPGIPGPASERISEIARKHGMYVVAGLYNYRAGEIRNTALVLDRRGEDVWRYEKIHPTVGEIEMGVVPGEVCPSVYDVEFGRLGFAICYDIGWPEHWDRLGDDGAELVFWPSAYDGGFPLQTYAWKHQYYVVSSVWSQNAKVIDIDGEILAQTTRFSRLVTQEIDLEKELFHTDDNATRLLALQAEHGHEITLKTRGEENVFTLQSNNPALPLAKLKEKFRLESFNDFHARAGRVQDRTREALVEAVSVRA